MEARTYAHTHIVPGRIQGSPWQKQDAGRAAYGVPWRPSSGGRGTGRVSTWVPGPGALLPRCPADAALPPHHSTAPPRGPGARRPRAGMRDLPAGLRPVTEQARIGIAEQLAAFQRSDDAGPPPRPAPPPLPAPAQPRALSAPSSAVCP